MLSKELEFTLNTAFKEARERRYEFMTVEHLLLALELAARLARLRVDLGGGVHRKLLEEPVGVPQAV